MKNYIINSRNKYDFPAIIAADFNCTDQLQLNAVMGMRALTGVGQQGVLMPPPAPMPTSFSQQTNTSAITAQHYDHIMIVRTGFRGDLIVKMGTQDIGYSKPIDIVDDPKASDHCPVVSSFLKKVTLHLPSVEVICNQLLLRLNQCNNLFMSGNGSADLTEQYNMIHYLLSKLNAAQALTAEEALAVMRLLNQSQYHASVSAVPQLHSTAVQQAATQPAPQFSAWQFGFQNPSNPFSD